jgi:hypothetical protein
MRSLNGAADRDRNEGSDECDPPPEGHGWMETRGNMFANAASCDSTGAEVPTISDVLVHPILGTGRGPIRQSGGAPQ